MTSTSSYSHSFRLPLDRHTAFQIFADPRRLDDLTPSWFRLRPLADLPKHLAAGTEISYRLWWRGLPFYWTSLVTDWRPPAFFAYEQQRGPYRFFRHEHIFDSSPGGTEIRDRVFFRSPGGRLTDQLITRPDLRRIFTFREQRALDLAAPATVLRRAGSPTDAR